MTAYYNEIDPFAAEWLRNLILVGAIAPGDVDTRDIRDVKPDDLKQYTQCHFFAGIGVWSNALRNAGWPDNRSVWTGSCPCQPFSAAGRRGGVADERHLWPHWYWLVSQCRPTEIFGEQVASKDGRAWFDAVSTDLEALGHAVGSADLCAAGVGAPHIRQRLWFYGTVADDTGEILEGSERSQYERDWSGRAFGSSTERLGNPSGTAFKRDTGEILRTENGKYSPWQFDGGESERFTNASQNSRLADAHGIGQSRPRQVGRSCNTETETNREKHRTVTDGGGERLADTNHIGREQQSNVRPTGLLEAAVRTTEQSIVAGDPRTAPVTANPNNSFWSGADWIGCRDNKFRPVESGTFPLVNGSTGRVGRLRGYGNAIVSPAAQAFIEATQGWD